MWTKWWAPASAGKWRMGFNLAFKGLKTHQNLGVPCRHQIQVCLMTKPGKPEWDHSQERY
jgi:hypothetical protein